MKYGFVTCSTVTALGVTMLIGSALPAQAKPTETTNSSAMKQLDVNKTETANTTRKSVQKDTSVSPSKSETTLSDSIINLVGVGYYARQLADVFLFPATPSEGTAPETKNRTAEPKKKSKTKAKKDDTTLAKSDVKTPAEETEPTWTPTSPLSKVSLGPKAEFTTVSESVASPKVGSATQPAEELVTQWAKEVSQNAKKPKKKKLHATPSTLTRAQTVSLTAWLLGDWGSFDSDYANGKMPDDFLKAPLTSPNQNLRHDAAIMFDLMSVDFYEEFGRPINIGNSYRTYEAQVSLKIQKPVLAAPAGFSNHGWGLALDLVGPEAQWDTVERNWLINNGWKYGWFSPDWAQRGKGKVEPWHFEYMGTTEIAWPRSLTLIERVGELNGDPLQGLNQK